MIGIINYGMGNMGSISNMLKKIGYECKIISDPKKNLQDICSKTLVDNKAEDVLTLDINGISSFADAIIIATANSNRHATSLSERLVESVKANGKTILGGEGKIESGWILVDCGEVVINIMKSDIREFYDLEGLWGENTLLNNSN